MRLTRRNALIGLGTVAAGAGVIGGTGAFTSVDADRELTISSTGDGSANVQIEVDPQGKHDSLSDGGASDVVQLDFSSLNQNAITTYDDALRINPTGSNGNYDVTVDIEESDGTAISWVSATVNGGTDISGGTNVFVDISIDLTSNDASSFPTDAVIAISVSQAN